MLGAMVLNVFPRHSLLEQALLKYEVVVILDSCCLQVLLSVLSFNEENAIEETSVFIVNQRHFDSEALIPSVRFGYREDYFINNQGCSEVGSQKE